MNAFELLKKDHEKVSTLFKEIESASGQSKTELFAQLKSELDLHANIEETIFYPALENTEEARDITLEAYEEHKVVKELLAELEGSAPSEEWDAKLTVLRENVEHHVEEEEGELFTKARQALSETEIEEIGNQIAAAKGEVPPPVAETRTRSTGKSRKSASASKKSGKRRGLLGTLANMVGLGGRARSAKSGSRQASSSRGGSTSSRGGTTKAASKGASKSTKKAGGKAAAKKSSTKTRGTKKAAKKSAAKKAGKKTSRGGKRAVVRTRSSASKRSGGTKGGSKSRKSGGSKKR